MMSSEKLERIVDESSQHDMLGSRFPITEDFHPTSTITNDDDFQDSDDEEEFVTMSKEAHEMFHDEALMTRRMVLKHRAKYVSRSVMVIIIIRTQHHSSCSRFY